MPTNPPPDRLLQECVEEVRSELALLRAELAALRNTPRTSLKIHNRCPICLGTSVLHCREIRDYNYGDSHTPMSLQLTGFIKKRGIGAFELFACRSCEFVEWYIKGAGEIDPEKLDKTNRKNTRIIDSETPKGGPFR